VAAVFADGVMVAVVALVRTVPPSAVGSVAEIAVQVECGLVTVDAVEAVAAVEVVAAVEDGAVQTAPENDAGPDVEGRLVTVVAPEVVAEGTVVEYEVVEGGVAAENGVERVVTVVVGEVAELGIVAAVE
jgi:hypothetical protein